MSLGIENTEEDIDRLLTVLGTIRQGRRDKLVVRQIDEFARTAAQEVYATTPA